MSREFSTDQVLITKISKGYFRTNVSPDLEYPGIDVEFVAEDDYGQTMSRPRIIFEYPNDGELRVLIWTDCDKEDYTEEIFFKIPTKKGEKQ